MTGVYKGTIITCDARNTIADYLVEKRGRIEYVGNHLPSTYDSWPVIDLGTKALIPSFADSHIHFASFARFNACPDVMSARSNTEILELLKEHAGKSHDKMIMAFGVSSFTVEEGRLISRQDLDSVSRTRQIVLFKLDGHACIVNQVLIDALAGQISCLRGFDAESGEMKEEAFFAISSYCTRSVPIFGLIRNMLRAFDTLAAKGIGKISSASGVGFRRDLDVDLERMVSRAVGRGFQMRLFFQTMDVDKVTRRKLPRVGGCFATALDGSLMSLDAALLEPYEKQDSKGVLFYRDDQVIDFCKKANRLGLQIEMHAVGDAAFNQAVRALKTALDDHPRQDHRHGIIHAFLPTEEGIRICAEYGIQIPTEAGIPLLNPLLRESLGLRFANLRPFRKFLDASIVMSLNSDGPSMKPDPIEWIHRACNRPVRDQSLTVFEALRMATYFGYWDTFDERERGSLEIGKIADMAVLSENPYEVPVAILDRIRVEQLILAGKPYRKQKPSLVRFLLKGLLSQDQGPRPTVT